MTYSARTIAYFTTWGLIYGVLLGAFSGTAILPYFGTMYSTLWGGGIGLASGILSGVVVAALRARSFNRDTDLDGLRQFLSIGIGSLITIAAPLMLFGSSRGILWGSGMLRDMLPWNALSLFAASFWGGLSSAYITSHYPAYMAHLTARREYSEFEAEVDRPQALRQVLTAFRTLLRQGLTRWVFLLGAIGGAFLNLSNAIRLSAFTAQPVTMTEGAVYLGIGGVLGIIGTFFLGLYVSFGVSSVITFLKRLIFHEYFSHLPVHWTRWILTLTTFVFTGAVTYWATIFTPIIAFIAALTVYRTLALPDETIDKAKRKEKNALALEEEGAREQGEEEILMEEERFLETRQR